MQNSDHSMSHFTVETLRKWFNRCVLSNFMRIHVCIETCHLMHLSMTVCRHQAEMWSSTPVPFHTLLCTLNLYNLIPLGTVCAILYTFSCCGVHWVQCSEAAILAQWVQWVRCCWRLAGWLDQVAVPDLWYQSPSATAAAAAAAATTVCCVALLLSSPPLLSASSSSSVLPLLWSLSTQLTPFIAIHPVFLSIQLPCPSFHPLCFSNTHIQGRSRQADSAGSVMNGILLHIRRKCTLQCGFTNCLHCPQNDSLYTAENGSQTDRQTDIQTDSTVQTDRLVCRAYRQTAQERQAERQIVCDRYSQNRTEADNLPIQKRPASSGYRQGMKDRWVTYTDRQKRVCHFCFQ